jgi:hypothetical protein
VTATSNFSGPRCSAHFSRRSHRGNAPPCPGSGITALTIRVHFDPEMTWSALDQRITSAACEGTVTTNSAAISALAAAAVYTPTKVR